MSSTVPSSRKVRKHSKHLGDDDSSPWPLSTLIKASVALYVFYLGLSAAYKIRLVAIQEYGPVIHEFDPYFNFRATEYLYWNGAERFFKWFDHRSWYPLGRPVGTTIYPGMQFIAVWIKRYLLKTWSLNDVCCYVPAWFGVMSSLITALIAYECTIPNNTSSSLVQFLVDIFNGKKTTTTSRSINNNHQFSSPALEAFLFTLCMMAIVPAHLMRSVGGGFDNESVAVTAMVLTFYCWVRSLRSGDAWSWLWAFGTAAAYFYMVAAWGGYVFVLNMIGMHAGVLVLLGRFDTKVWASYSIFYALGTALAIQIPVVGWTPLKSLEQLGPCAVFLGYQLLQVCETIRKRQNLSRIEAMKLRVRVFGAASVVAILILLTLVPKGYFGPMSARVRGLFVKHTKTGNPLVDSVAEHQPASRRAYFQYLHHVCSLAPIGYLLVMANLSDASSFLVVWATASYFFSHKMVRLILLLAPIGSILAGIGAARIFAWSLQQLWEMESSVEAPLVDASSTSANGESDIRSSKDAKKKKTPKKPAFAAQESSFEGLIIMRDTARTMLKTKEGIFFKRTIALLALCLGWYLGTAFVTYSFRIAYDLSNPSIIVKARDAENRVIKVDDYREAYWWLRDNTPDDARIMAWWDYGYQIAAIGNRTTIADGNTWNHEHIALLGLTLTTDLDEGWEIARHWADYILVWASGRGDDMAKSPHLARIANSVYREHCPDDPTCRRFGFIDRQGTPSPMMARSLLYRLHSHGKRPGVSAPEDKFQEVYKSRHGWVRVYKIIGVSEESRAWSADIANKKCDSGGWYCPGQYPPAMEKVLARKKDFSQLEDFNRGKGDEEYTKKYFEDLNNPQRAQKNARANEKASTPKADINVDEIYQRFEDTEDTTLMWKLISSDSFDELKTWLAEEPHKAFIRSKDGRGPMWWSFEQKNQRITDLLMKAGVPHTDGDLRGMTPVDLLQGGK
ncbi:hypothetical protein MPSEU_000202300 [Mayamaea pseudoterrestris]|nr:hypothetical protein MPSEU_000202300 [Mayamaea pseudoterrestris]